MRPVISIHATSPITAHHITAATIRKFASPRYSRNTATSTAAIATSVAGPAATPTLYDPTRAMWLTACPAASPGHRYVAYWLNPIHPDATESGAENVS